ncbi:phosphoglyceromutase [Sorangium cellulosum]|uniref:2,3-bisphosphoglycerate-independent phosphoglycerate mutase n=1 Tax=Sorangium cellulosum TaxID=56 RepID=A0A4P2PV10_SORCE|nr:2,3-bisphosphoglycerate-independent phosphoglycerate mutase [Sorangium cellulosum]AUX20547.1 phosphoglyceromutase [Sorangium cellulosum]
MSEAAPTPSTRPRPLVLCILDGFGERAEKDDNAIALAKAPHLQAIQKSARKTLIGTSGPDVGLPVGQMGNSEVGHLNFGAGRIALMDISRIDVAIAENKLGSNEIIARTFRIAQDRKCRLHLFGLLSDGGVHSSLDHFFALFKLARFHEVPIVLHAFLDGRDTPPKSAWGYIERTLAELEGVGVIGTLSGRYYAMDRDKRWDRVMKAYTAIVRGDAPRADTAYEAIEASYAAGKTDEFVEPVRIGDYKGIQGDFVADFAAKDPRWEWQGEEVGLAVNFRPDRMREISAMLTRRNLPPEVEELLSDRGKPVYAFQEHCYSGMTEYDAALKLPVAFPKDEVTDSFPEVIARAGLTQLRCAETEKYAHVTYFFNGGREAAFPGEDRKLVPSPRDVATYDQKPEMSAAGVAGEVTAAVKSGKYDFILVNFANPDMVGHTGILEAAIHAVEAVDTGVGAIADAVREAGGAMLITADHGNCEQMKDEQGNPHTAHTLNPVPLYYLNQNDPGIELRSGGRICDVAPTMLEILGLPQPAAMTGRSLRVRQR